MKVRYKTTGEITYASQFNVTALSEVLTCDDSPFISELDVWIEAKQEWVDMRQAFRDKDLITDNYNTIFFELETEEDKLRGFTL